MKLLHMEDEDMLILHSQYSGCLSPIDKGTRKAAAMLLT